MVYDHKCYLSGSGDHDQLSNVPAHHDPWMDLRLGVGKEGGNMVNGGSSSY